MDPVSIIAVAVGLSMDAFAVSVASGIAIKNRRVAHAVRMALFFGGFQAVMPVVGWLAGRSVADLVSPWDHWVVFAVLTFIGVKMIYEAFRIEAAGKPTHPFNVYVLLVLAVATSLDALAVGFSFAFLVTDIVTPVLIIGSVTFVLSLAGVAVGDRLGHFFEKKIEIVGGLVLIAIGVKILLEDLLV